MDIPYHILSIQSISPLKSFGVFCPAESACNGLI
jgi:hypothetical protein